MPVKRILLLTELLVLIFAAVLVMWALILVPASLWLDVRSVRILDSKLGSPIVMVVDRTIKRDFPGKWAVTVRDVEGAVWCSARGEAEYSSRAKLPTPLTLQWWTFPSCYPVPVGSYTATTRWTIQDLPFLPSKSVVVESNIFRVTE